MSTPWSAPDARQVACTFVRNTPEYAHIMEQIKREAALGKFHVVMSAKLPRGTEAWSNETKIMLRGALETAGYRTDIVTAVGPFTINW